MNKLYSSGQSVTLSTGQSYTLKDNEVMINTVIYRKADIEITLENNGVISDSKDVRVGIRKRDGVSGMPAHYENYENWYIDGTQQTTLADCVENINTAIYYTSSSGGVQKQADLSQTDKSEPDYVKNVDKAVIMNASRNLQLSDRGVIIFATGGFHTLTLQDLGTPFGLTIDVDNNSQLTIDANGMTIINLSDDLVINATQNAKLYRLDNGDWVFMKGN